MYPNDIFLWKNRKSWDAESAFDVVVRMSDMLIYPDLISACIKKWSNKVKLIPPFKETPNPEKWKSS